MDRTTKFLKDITDAHGVPGFEEAAFDVLERRLRNVAQVGHDNLGSFIATLKGGLKAPRVALVGHMDEVGFMVKEITEEGFVKFMPLGGWWGHVVLGQRLLIKTKKGDITGVVGAKAPHELKPDERKKVLDIKEMFIDVGAVEKYDVKKKLGVRPGDPIVPVSEFATMSNPKMLLAKAWDNRIGCAAMTEALLALSKARHPNKVVGVGTVQEEVGLRGAATSAWVVDPDVAIILDVSLAGDIPGSEHNKSAKLGLGPSINVLEGSTISHPRLRDLVIETAEKAKIPFHFGALPSGGTDAGRYHLSRAGVPSIYLGVASRYIHTHNSIIHRDDFDNLVKLVVAVVKRLDTKTVSGLTKR
jgi:putative aminopeptidase FrvX